MKVDLEPVNSLMSEHGLCGLPRPGHRIPNLIDQRDATILHADHGTPRYPAMKGQTLRGFGWEIDTFNSTPRGLNFLVGSFRHTGFTGTMPWIDPGSDTYVVLLSNSIHLRGSPPIQELRGEVATAAQALGL